MKYSSCYFPEGNETLGEAENKMFELYCERAQLQDGENEIMNKVRCSYS